MNSLFSNRLRSTLTVLCLFIIGCSVTLYAEDSKSAERNLIRAMILSDSAFENYFSRGMKMSRFYNPMTGKHSKETGSVWMYTSAIEACNAIIEGLQALEQDTTPAHKENIERYIDRLDKLYEGLSWYEGRFTLTSYTQTKEWTVYGVNRGKSPGNAEVAGIMNVYDDQQWLIKELLISYKLTRNKKYLEKAEYLTEYVIDGWDTTLDAEGNEYGGITWGPGYITKHSCSNGPFITPLVWLHELYKGSQETVGYRYIDSDGERKVRYMSKEDYYLMYAEKVYSFQKTHLFQKENGVYYDMLGGVPATEEKEIAYEVIGNTTYRAHNKMKGPVGRAYSYNSGTMLSGAADLYRSTGNKEYLDDMISLADACFRYFAKGPGRNGLYRYASDGFNNWFNCVLLRGWIDAGIYYEGTADACRSIQTNLDWAWDRYLYKDMLPANLIWGWKDDISKNNIEGMFMFAFASEYAYLAIHQQYMNN